MTEQPWTGDKIAGWRAYCDDCDERFSLRQDVAQANSDKSSHENSNDGHRVKVVTEYE